MFKKMYKYFLLLILLIRSLFTSDDDGANVLKEKHDMSKKNENIILYKESKKISKRVVELTNSLIDKEQKNKLIDNLSDELKTLEEKVIETKPISKVDLVAYDKTLEKIHDDKTTLKFYSYVTKEEVSEPVIEEEKIISREIDMEDVLNLAKMENKTKEVYSIYVTLANSIIKDTTKIFKDIEEDIRCNRNHENNKYKIEIINEKIRKIKENYYEFKHNRYIYEIENDFELKQIDKAGILKDDDKIDELLSKTSELLNKIEQAKLKNSEVAKKDSKESKKDKEVKKENIKKEEKQEKQEKTPKLLQDIIEAANIIEKNIEYQAKLIERLEDEIITAPTFEVKSRRVNFFENILNNTLKFTTSINIFRMYRNRKLSNLINGFILNNNIRTMRKSLTNSSICNYITLSKQLKKETDLLLSYERICNDSMYQVSILKEEFLNRYGYLNNIEVKKLYLKLESLEEYIGRELDRINESKVYLKGKVKKISKS